MQSVDRIVQPPEYIDLRNHLQSIISDEIKTKKYEFLKGSNTRSGKNAIIPNLKARVNTLPRPIPMSFTGERNLDAGSDEVVLVIQGPLTYDSDYSMGWM